MNKKFLIVSAIFCGLFLAGGPTISNAQGEWMNCLQLRERAGIAATELLQGEGFQTPIVFDSYVRQFANGFLIDYHFNAKLPEDAGYRFQTVIVKTETRADDRTQCRILGVELGKKVK